jgi:uncharacterized protein (TIGR04255 family)
MVQSTFVRVHRGFELPVASFKNPPVGEVWFGLRLAPLTAFKAVHYGAFWDLIRKDYPECEDQSPVFDQLSPYYGGPESFPLPRVWYLHRDRNYLIQLQPNRIWLNWRRLTESDQYPRFESLFPAFQETIARFAEFARANNIGDVMAVGGELSYVNHIPSLDSAQLYSDVGEFMDDVRWGAHRSLPTPDGLAWRTEFSLGKDKLFVDLKTGRERAGAQRAIFILEIRAATVFEPTSAAGDCLGWFHTANRLIVDAFCEVTTEKAQREHWQRID